MGDALLSTIIAEYLFNFNPKAKEGKLTKLRAKISRKNLNEIGKEMLDDKLFVHKVKNISHNMYGNYLEAIIGALYL